MSEGLVPKKDWKDLIHRVIKGGIALAPVPFAGAIAEMYDYVLVAPYTKRMQEFVYHTFRETGGVE